MEAPIPELPPGFDQRVMRAVRRSSQPLGHYRRMLIVGYGLVSAVTCAVVMRGQGLGWWAVAGTTLAPLALVAVTRPAWRAGRTSVRPGAT
jgi:hypothetical protein